jgi:hypothetical protein
MNKALAIFAAVPFTQILLVAIVALLYLNLQQQKAIDRDINDVYSAVTGLKYAISGERPPSP